MPGRNCYNSLQVGDADAIVTVVRSHQLPGFVPGEGSCAPWQRLTVRLSTSPSQLQRVPVFEQQVDRKHRASVFHSFDISKIRFNSRELHRNKLNDVVNKGGEQRNLAAELPPTEETFHQKNIGSLGWYCISKTIQVFRNSSVICYSCLGRWLRAFHSRTRNS